MQMESTLDSFSTSFEPDSFSSSGHSSYHGYNSISHGYNSSSHGYNTMSGESIVTDSTGMGRRNSHSVAGSESDASSGYLNDYTDFEASIPNEELAEEHRKIISTKHTRKVLATPSPTTPRPDLRWRCNQRRKCSTQKKVLNNFTCHQSTSVDLLMTVTLPTVDRVPWSDQDLLNTLRRGRASSVMFQHHLPGTSSPLSPLTVPLDVVQKLGHMLQYPLVRIAREARRLSLNLKRCGRHEIQVCYMFRTTTTLHNSPHPLLLIRYHNNTCISSNIIKKTFFNSPQ